MKIKYTLFRGGLTYSQPATLRQTHKQKGRYYMKTGANNLKYDARHF